MMSAFTTQKKLGNLLKDAFSILFINALFRKKVSLLFLWISLLWVVFGTFIYYQYLHHIFSNIGPQAHSFIFGDIIENNTLLAIGILLLFVFFWLCLSNICKIGILRKLYSSEGLVLKINNLFSSFLKIIFFSILQIPSALILILFIIIGILFDPLFIPILVMVCCLFPILYSWSNLCFYHYTIQDNGIIKSMQLGTKNYKKNLLKNTLNTIIIWNIAHGILVLFICFFATMLWPLIENSENIPQIFVLYLYISTLIFLGCKSFFWINQIFVFTNGNITPLTTENKTQLNHEQSSE